MKDKEIYAFDFDGTIVTNEYPKIGKPIKQVIDMILEVKSRGNYIILNTMRENKTLMEALMFCKSLGIEFDAVNDNLPHMKEFYKNNPRKIFANYYIDDHNMFISEINAEVIGNKIEKEHAKSTLMSWAKEQLVDELMCFGHINNDLHETIDIQHSNARFLLGELEKNGIFVNFDCANKKYVITKIEGEK